MTANTTIIVVVALFVLFGVGAFMVYRRRIKAGIKAPGFEMNLDASNDPIPNKPSQPRKWLAGVLGNWSFGKTRIEVKGPGTVAGNRSVGDTEIEVDANTSPPPAETSKPQRKRK